MLSELVSDRCLTFCCCRLALLQDIEQLSGSQLGGLLDTLLANVKRVALAQVGAVGDGIPFHVSDLRSVCGAWLGVGRVSRG